MLVFGQGKDATRVDAMVATRVGQPASANTRQLLVQLLGGRPGTLTRVHLPASGLICL
ncbi:hypothetical protein F2Q70_00016396 [Brassica cretica]|uniref:Uncharacterized protein n=1 Tax=Brassica cretica TaxID=69181 RepID=A0A8S9HQP8_BRACR|nr:hypothetical protein F2Q70_00016396 [Brassica cretica]KAF2596952.1 hypothetical protein F2Q68_00009362 [Brassica cretica]